MRSAALRRGQSLGFTLLELMIAIALLSVVAVLSFRGLDSILNTRERIVEASDELRALTVSFAQIEEDMRRSWPSRLLNLGAPALSFAPGPIEGQSQLQLLRENTGAASRDRVQRVIYRVREGRLERGFGMWVRGTTTTTETMTWQPLLERVAAVQMRVWVEEQGNWIEAAGLAALPNNPSVSGLELALARQNGERVIRVIAVRD